MKRVMKRFAGGLLLSALVLTGCSKDKETPNEEELITTVVLTFQEQGTSNVFSAIFRDADGEGGNPPSAFDEIVLKPNTKYTCAVTLLNESVNPAEDITEEVEEEAVDHQFYFIPTPPNINITILDKDANNLPVGITSEWQTAAASTGTVRVVLKHKPGVKATGDAVTVGDTDIDLNFTYKLQ
ncbi:hypothetical protein KJS94_17575 [Flavihumibacter rivuli]|uniref:hypothetical protein n=1 Tax=Flavihumibacter rivuli TaxID=2838156 RepID=UPI001BDE4D85|nr:hypothetical protein [Flavihumibacter rivuli]ULQ56463.1 hypothetical protein KJS94_17575 [Flavihumibacter rivuli]